MGVAEIVYLCIVIAFLFFGIGYDVCVNINDYKCNHKYEEIANTINSNGKGTVVYMCKHCGKRKITKV